MDWKFEGFGWLEADRTRASQFSNQSSTFFQFPGPCDRIGGSDGGQGNSRRRRRDLRDGIGGGDTGRSAESGGDSGPKGTPTVTKNASPKLISSLRDLADPIPPSEASWESPPSPPRRPDAFFGPATV